jgi:hypothetical protein
MSLADGIAVLLRKGTFGKITLALRNLPTTAKRRSILMDIEGVSCCEANKKEAKFLP